MSIPESRPNLTKEELVINAKVAEIEGKQTTPLNPSPSFDNVDNPQPALSGEVHYLDKQDSWATSKKSRGLQQVLEQWTQLVIVCNIAAPLAAITVSWYASPMIGKSSNLKYDVTSCNLFYLCCACVWFNLLNDHRDLKSLLQKLRKVSLIVVRLQCLSRLILSIFSIITCWTSSEGLKLSLFSYTSFPLLQFASTLLLPVIQLLIATESTLHDEDGYPCSKLEQHDIPSRIKFASQEVHDVAHMVTSIIEQYAQTSISTASQAALSSCSIAMPIVSILAIGTAMKHAIHVSSCLQQSPNRSTNNPMHNNSFDLCELLQSVGDAIEGICAKRDVAMVIYFTDSEWKEIYIESNQGYLRHGLINILTKLLDKAASGSTIEMNLNIRSMNTFCDDMTSQCGEAPGTIFIDINMSVIQRAENQDKHLDIFKSDFLPNQIELLGGTINVSGSSKEGGQTVKVSFMALQSSNDDTIYISANATNVDGSDIGEDHQALESFNELLKDMKIALYALDDSIFSKHLTNCLTNWSMNITHFSINEQCQHVDGMGNDRTFNEAASSTTVNMNHPYEARFPIPPSSPYTSPTLKESAIYGNTVADFIIIDDDIPTLKRHIMNRQAAIASDTFFRSRPTAHRTNGGFTGRLDIRYTDKSPQSTIIFFTSLKNYKQVREIMLTNVNPWSKQSIALSQIMAVPKPACPRRILTALFTAWRKISFDPQFTPIATMPPSPLTSNSSYSSQVSCHEFNTPPTPHGEGHLPDSNGRRHDRSLDSPAAKNAESSHYFSSSYSMLHSPKSNSPKNHAAPAGMMVDEGMLFVPENRSPRLLPRTKNPMKKSQMIPKMHGSIKQDRFLERPKLNDLPINQSSSGIPKTRSPYVMAGEFLDDNIYTTVPKEDGDDVASMATDNSTFHNGTKPDTLIMQSSPTRTFTLELDNNQAVALPSKDNQLSIPHLTSDMEEGYENAAPNQSQPPQLTETAAAARRASLKRKKKVTIHTSVSPPIQVLIVEDNIINQVILSKWMKSHGIKYAVASNGQEAFDKWSEGAFHLILMDIQLPVMDGITCTKKIRACEMERKSKQWRNDVDKEVVRSMSTGSVEKETKFRSHVIIVALTASSLDSDRQEALAAGCNDFLTKPVNLEWLERKITEWGCMQALIDYESWRQWREAKLSTAAKQAIDDKQPDASQTVKPERKANGSNDRSGILMRGGSAIKPLSHRSATT